MSDKTEKHEEKVIVPPASAPKAARPAAPETVEIECLRVVPGGVTVTDDVTGASFTFERTDKVDTMRQRVPRRIAGLLGLTRKPVPGILDVADHASATGRSPGSQPYFRLV